MDKKWNIILKCNNTFDSLKFKFKNYISLFKGLDTRFFILMLNKRFIYFVNLTICKSKNIFAILF